MWQHAFAVDAVVCEGRIFTQGQHMLIHPVLYTVQLDVWLELANWNQTIPVCQSCKLAQQVQLTCLEVAYDKTKVGPAYLASLSGSMYTVMYDHPRVLCP